MDADTHHKQIVARSVIKLARRQIALAEEVIRTHGLRPEIARTLWHWRAILAEQDLI